ncbi:complement C1q-like protein 4 isoform X2 [Sander lucioperca]|uniref:complement C1q-like protein 4 isoform X2 n=1 Tax=Sander lucioperca TaxID=283035 RepID=UPI00125DB2A6|nr:complement C1q-like protein 4 isoform X2 [Sander lucioperca]
MKISVSFTLWLLLGAVFAEVSTDSSQDIFVALREMTASLVQLKADMIAGQAQLKTEMDILKQQQLVRQVAFSAGLLAVGQVATIGPFPTNTPLIFKHVPTNIGNAYNSNTGVFTAPVRGAYHFEWWIGAVGDGRHSVLAVLVKNSEGVFTAYESQTAGYMSASNGVTLLLEVGDTVFVRLWAGHRVYDDGGHRTTFSGHLLFPM